MLGSDRLQADAWSLQRQAFQIADAALKQGDTWLFNSLKAGLEDYPLYPYLLYRDLQQRLEHNPASEVRRFLRTYTDSPVADRLRTLWLKQLAQEQRWSDFLKDYQGNQSIAMDCRYRQALLHTGRAQEALAGITQIWMSGASLPPACDPLFQRWREQGGFTPEQIWQRLALALDAGQIRLAGYLRGLLSGRKQALADLWIAVHKEPSIVLDSEHFDLNDPHTTAILIHGLQRWSKRDSVATGAALDILKRRYTLPEDKLAPLERQLALYIASRGHPDALSRLTALPMHKVDTAVQEWRVRVSLRKGDWNGVLQWLQQMEKTTRESPRWQYWQARALEATGDNVQAQALYSRVANQRDYYGFLAAERLNVPYRIESAPVPVSTQDTLPEQLPGILRARELYLLGRYHEARSEWRQATAALNTQGLQQAAKLAERWGWHHQAIITLVRSAYWDDLELRFPLPYQEQIVANAEAQGIDPAWVYGLMRQESIFQGDARPPVGALGLMQIMPATGRRIAEDLQQTPADNDTLLDIGTNIRYGTYYLRFVLDKFRGHTLLATAAYNAGPKRVQDWLPQKQAVAADVWAETIPFFETRKYVQRVLAYTAIFQWRLQRTTPSLKHYMTPVLPINQSN